MMYYSVLASFCLLGMATSQTITSLTACQTKEQNLQMECKFSKDTLSKMPIICSYELDKKVVASSNNSKPVDATYKDRGTAIITGETCMLELKGFSDDSPKTYICNIQQDKSVTQELSVEKKKLSTCSAGNTLKHGGVILLLAFVLPLLSEML